MSSQAAAPEPLLTRDFVLLVVAHFLQALGYASMLLLPLYLQHLQASRTEIGVLMAISAISGLLLRPVVGWALDTVGRKPTLVVGTLMLVAGMAMVALVDRIGVIIYLQRVVFGIGLGTLFAGYFTFAADIIPESRRTEGLALFGISGLVPLLVNPLSDQLSVAPADLRWFLPAVGGAILLSLVFVLLLPERAPAQSARFDWREALDALGRRRVYSVWLATMIFSGLVAVFMTFATVTAERRGVPRPASLWLSYAVGAVAVRLFGARLPDKVGLNKVLAAALGIYLVAALVAAQAHSFSQFMLAGLLAGLGHGYCFPVLTSQVVGRVPASFRGSALACFTALWGVSELLGSPVFGAIADHFSDAVMFQCAAVFGGLAMIGWALLEWRWGTEQNVE